MTTWNMEITDKYDVSEDEYTKGFKTGVQAISEILIADIFKNCPQEARIYILSALKHEYEDLYMQVAKID